ncbi:MAG: hypothetical protein V4557_14815 [Bacteroidota bacterium]
MVTVIAVHKRCSKEGKPFMVLELQGTLELVQSSVNGKFYATSKRCFITSTFSEEVAEAFIGNKMEGEICRVACDPYDFKVPNTGEIIRLNYTYDFRPVEVVEKKRENRSQSVIMNS